jgi:AraC-like DNA-binding protein
MGTQAAGRGTSNTAGAYLSVEEVSGSTATHTRRQLLGTDDLTVLDYRCRDHDPGWTFCDPHVGRALIMVRRGSFRRRVEGEETLVDAGVAFFRRDEGQEEVAHPVPGGDDDTMVTLPDPIVAQLLGDDGDLPQRVVFTSPEADLRLRLLLAACGRGETTTAADQAVALITSILRLADPARIEAGRPATSAARRRVVDGAREALAVDPSLGLLELARLVSVSPYHLSRIFRAVTGQTLSTYRRRLRLRSALDQIREGHQDLAAVAADAGFSDHAHLTRTFRRELGTVPTNVRQLIAPAPRSY